ncbi:MAG: DUF881 domain-containing protein [Sarcina sp.]
MDYKKNKKILFMIFIMTVIVFSTENKKNINFNLREYSNVEKERKDLISEIDFLINENKKIIKVLKNEEKIERNFEKEELLFGNISVEGEGIIIRLKDGEISKELDGFIKNKRTIHNSDIIELLNQLKILGAQGISINERRIIYNSSVYCAGQFLVVDGIKTPAPFEIKVISNLKNIDKNLMLEQNIIKNLINRGINIEIFEEKNIKLPFFNNKYR